MRLAIQRLLLLAAALIVAWAPCNVRGSDPPPPQGAALLKTDLMAVYAHPDDETGASAALAYYARGRQKVVTNVYCTRGEGGGNMVGTQWGPSLGVLREAELRRCLDRLGVRYCYFLDQQDFFYTESVAATFEKWGKEQTLGRLIRAVRALRPEVIITMNPTPTPGQHGHHQAAGILATEAFDAAADPARFPEQLTKEGLAVWQPAKLYYGGAESGQGATIAVKEALADGTSPADLAGLAAAEHRSQGFGGFARSPWMRRPQAFTLVKSVVPFEPAEDDLFRGLPVPESGRKRLAPPAPPAGSSSLTIEFVPRPTMGSFRAWARGQGIEHLSSKLLADVCVVAGDVNVVRLEIRNAGGKRTAGDLALTAPPGWRLDPPILKFDVPAGGVLPLEFGLTPPTGAAADGEISAALSSDIETPRAVAKAHPVPVATAVRVKSTPALDGSDAGWEDVVPLEIGPTNIAEGRVDSGADSSARFRLAHDGTALFVDVDVSDDVVVSNIAPNDIRGHWRSDSIEICIDPDAGSEHTLGCFKLGIFPFDNTGVVRAARDADANQGPIEETALAVRVVSRRTPVGYRIQAAIPFKELGISSTAGKRIGFNLIMYDGDKAGAAPGENINKSRIAWSPRPGVQGRPEDWGRVDLAPSADEK